MADECELHLKLLLLGDTAVGKTCLLLQFTENNFNPIFTTTIGIDFKIKIVDVDGVKTRLQIWDTAGQERFRTITVSYFRGANAIILVYDITDRESFDAVVGWIEQIKTHADSDISVILLANKCDLEKERVVSKVEGERLAARFKLELMETSAKSHEMVVKAFDAIALTAKRRCFDANGRSSQDGSVSLRTESSSSKGCC